MRSSVDTQLLLSSASSVKTIAGQFEAELAQLKSLVDGTADAWEGPAKDSFLGTYEKYQKSMNEFIASLGVYSDAMTTFANRREEDEQAGSARFDSI